MTKVKSLAKTMKRLNSKTQKQQKHAIRKYWKGVAKNEISVIATLAAERKTPMKHYRYMAFYLFPIHDGLDRIDLAYNPELMKAVKNARKRAGEAGFKLP